MKLKNNHHNHAEGEGSLVKHIPNKIRQYLRSVYNSSKCKSMSHGSYDIMRAMSWGHGENWRRCHPKSLKKHH
jgi:hypothetical protein